MEPLVIDVHEAARLTSLSPYTIRAYVKRGRIPAIRVCRRLLIEVEALRRWIEESRDGSSKRDAAGGER